MIILTLPDGSLPWSLEDWFMQSFDCVYVGYSQLLDWSWEYTLYVGNDIEGEHSFFFSFGKIEA